MEPGSRTARRDRARPLLARLDRLCRLAGEVAALKGEAATLRRIVSAAVEVVGVPEAHLALVDSERRTLFGVISSGRHPARAPKARFELQRGRGALTALRTRRPVVVRSAAGDRRVDPEARARLRIGSVAYVPLLGGGDAFGLLILTTPRPHAWSHQEVRLATYVAGVASVAIQTSHLLERLALAEGRFRYLLEDIPAIVYTCEVEWPYRSHYVSPQAETLLGYPPKAWIDDPDLFFRMVHPDDVGKIVADAEEAVRGRGFVRTEYRMLDRGGNIRWFRDEAVLVRDPAGRPVAWHGVLIEVGRFRETEAAPTAGALDRPETPAPPRAPGG
jgi:PAS domain S-box-containing protein